MVFRFSSTRAESRERPRLVCTTTPVALTVRFRFSVMAFRELSSAAAASAAIEKRSASRGADAVNTAVRRASMVWRMAGKRTDLGTSSN